MTIKNHKHGLFDFINHYWFKLITFCFIKREQRSQLKTKKNDYFEPKINSIKM